MRQAKPEVKIRLTTKSCIHNLCVACFGNKGMRSCVAISFHINVYVYFPAEMCLTSNVCTRTSTSYAGHHFKQWHERNHPLIICVSLLTYMYVFFGSFGLSTKEPYTNMRHASSSLASSCIGIGICAHLPQVHG